MEQSDADDRDQVHVAVVGPSAAGKSSLCLMYTTRTFEAKHQPTQTTKKYYTRCTTQKRDVLLYLEDTEPSDMTDLRSLLKPRIFTDSAAPKKKKNRRRAAASAAATNLLEEDTNGREGFIVVFDVGSRDSFEKAQKLIAALHKRVHYVPGEGRRCPVPVVLIGNKCDLKKGEREVFDMEADNYARSFEEQTSDVNADDPSAQKRHPSHISYVECSAKTSQGVEEAVKIMVDFAGQNLLTGPKAERECCGGCSVM